MEQEQAWSTPCGTGKEQVLDQVLSRCGAGEALEQKQEQVEQEQVWSTPGGAGAGAGALQCGAVWCGVGALGPREHLRSGVGPAAAPHLRPLGGAHPARRPRGIWKRNYCVRNYTKCILDLGLCDLITKSDISKW